MSHSVTHVFPRIIFKQRVKRQRDLSQEATNLGGKPFSLFFRLFLLDQMKMN